MGRPLIVLGDKTSHGGAVIEASSRTDTHGKRIAVSQLVAALKTYFNIETSGGHREYQRKSTSHGRACPGVLGMIIVEMLRNEHGLAAP